MMYVAKRKEKIGVKITKVRKGCIKGDGYGWVKKIKRTI
jgi:hypothetical protein